MGPGRKHKDSFQSELVEKFFLSMKLVSHVSTVASLNRFSSKYMYIHVNKSRNATQTKCILEGPVNYDESQYSIYSSGLDSQAVWCALKTRFTFRKSGALSFVHVLYMALITSPRAIGVTLSILCSLSILYHVNTEKLTRASHLKLFLVRWP